MTAIDGPVVEADIVIIGSGPTGLGAAQRLRELMTRREIDEDTRVIILEQQDGPGGLASSVRDDNGFLWDNGGHVVFSHYAYFDMTLNRAVPLWNRRVRAAFAFMKGSGGKRRFIPYPVQNNIHLMDKGDQRRCLSGLMNITKSPAPSRPAENFDDWLLRKFGVGLCDVFMRKYNKKVWTVNTTEMNSAWVGERVAVPDVGLIKTKIKQVKNGTLASDSEGWGPNSFFRFPRFNGTGSVWRAVAELLPSRWFRFGERVIAAHVDDKFITVEAKRNSSSIRRYNIAYKFLISTAPLDIFVGMLKSSSADFQQIHERASRLVYSHTHIVGIGLAGKTPKTLADKSWMYFPDDDSPFYRVTVFSSYSSDHVPKPGLQWSLMCEAAEPKRNLDQKYWTKANLIKRTVEALELYGFISRDMVVSEYYRRLNHGYPVPSLERDNILESVQPWLEARDVYARGRFGGWKYEVGNQDHSFMQGVEVADQIVSGTPEETYPAPNEVNSKRNTGRVLDATDYEFVIAHYDENIDWLRPLADHAHIYHKGADVAPPFAVYRWDKLPNVGRESHTYLHHIIANYDSLSNVTVFHQADGNKHQRWCFEDLLEFVSSAHKGIPGKIKDHYLRNWGRIHHLNRFSDKIKNKQMRASNMTMGEFYKALYSTKPPKKGIRYCFSGCFGATKESIRKQPVSFYKKAISFINDHPDPEEGHYFERLWCHMFSNFSGK